MCVNVCACDMHIRMCVCLLVCTRHVGRREGNELNAHSTDVNHHTPPVLSRGSQVCADEEDEALPGLDGKRAITYQVNCMHSLTLSYV